MMMMMIMMIMMIMMMSGTCFEHLLLALGYSLFAPLCWPFGEP